jgi:hypothetical protein
LAGVGPIRSSPYPAIYVRTGSATHSAQPVAKGTSRLPKATASRAKSFREKAWHSWHTSSFLALAGEEVIKQFARLLKLSCVCLVANFEDGIGQQLSAFRCRLRGCMEEIQAAYNAPPRLRPIPVRRDQRAAVAQRTERSRAATRREPVPRFRRQLLFLPVLRESVSWPRSWCGSRASPLLRTANWTVD